MGKVLHVHAGHSLSLQYHERKDESWYVQAGRARLELQRDGLRRAERGDHRAGRGLPPPARDGSPVSALEDTTIVEVSTPHLDDVVRLEDAYGREGTKEP